MSANAVVRVCRADYANPAHAAAVVNLLDAYARDPMGGAESGGQTASVQRAGVCRGR
jgi:hypothetical protein